MKKFKDRATAVSRIWKAIPEAPAELDRLPTCRKPETAPIADRTSGCQPETVQPGATAPETPAPATDAPVAPQPPEVAPEAAPATTKVARAKKAPKPATEPGTPRDGSKTSQVIAMLKVEGGTTLEEIMAKMGWLKHTTRAMLSAGGSLTKKHGLTVVSEKIRGTSRSIPSKDDPEPASAPTAAGFDPSNFLRFLAKEQNSLDYVFLSGKSDQCVMRGENDERQRSRFPPTRWNASRHCSPSSPATWKTTDATATPTPP